MFLTLKQQVKQLSKNDYLTLKKLCHIAKNLVNEAIYNIRQHFFNENKYLNYNENYKKLKNSVNYKTLNSNMAQQLIRQVDSMFQSFFELLKAKRNKTFEGKVQIPHYLDKEGYTNLIIGFVRIKENKLIIPFSNSFKKNHNKIEIKIPPKLVGKSIKQIRILPKYDARFFEIEYVYEISEENLNLDKTNALAIDLGLNNFSTCVTSTGKSFIIDGRKIKSINRWYNKRNAYLQSIKDKQKNTVKITKKQVINTRKRNNRINDYMNKSARYIINYCINNDIGTLICGYNQGFKDEINLGNKNNQTMVQIPYAKFVSKLKYMAELVGIDFIVQEESYTSKASFFDNDDIPLYNTSERVEYTFSGKRVKRGLYKTSNGKLINADVNGALNILKKSNVVDLNVLYSRGELNTPMRIRVV